MAHSFNNIDLTTYGIEASKISGSNITIKGGFDLPARLGKTGYRWDDEHGVEAYVEADEIFFGGRDIEFHGVLTGTKAEIFSGISAFNTAANAVSGTNVFATPYGNFNVYVKKVDPKMYAIGAEVRVIFREPAPSLTGGSIPSTALGAYQIDGIPFASFGLYCAPVESINELPGMKEMYFTKIEAEGWRNAFRKEMEFDLEAVIIGTTLVNFQAKVKNLYAIFMSPGIRTINLNNEISVLGYAADGFSISNIYRGNIGWTLGGVALDTMIGKFKCRITRTE